MRQFMLCLVAVFLLTFPMSCQAGDIISGINHYCTAFEKAETKPFEHGVIKRLS